MINSHILDYNWKRKREIWRN